MSIVRPHLHKLSYLSGREWQEHSFAPIFATSRLGEGTERLVAGIPGGDVLPFERLALALRPPYVLLYVLHTPRGEGDPGRYESPELDASELRSFLEQFGCYLSADARFDLWVYSATERATIVWDRHNQLFAYGPLERLASELRALGFQLGQPQVPIPHRHNYSAECDAQASNLLTSFEWSHSPLLAADEQ